MRRRKTMGRARGIALAGACLLALAPTVAHAATVQEQAESFIAKFLVDTANAQFAGIAEHTRQIASTSGLMDTLRNALGDGGVFYGQVTAASHVVVRPIALSILCLVVLVQLFEISRKYDANAQLPVVREVLTLAVYFAVCVWLINISTDLCEAIFDIAAGIVNSFSSQLSAGSVEEMVTPELAYGSVGVGEVIGIALAALITSLLSTVAGAITQLVVMARVLQVYAMVFLSPIPLSLMGMEQTRQFAVGFLKSFVSLSLAGVMMFFIIAAYPTILNILIVSSNHLAEEGGLYMNWITASLVMNVLYIWALTKSGAWAQSLFG